MNALGLCCFSRAFCSAESECSSLPWFPSSRSTGSRHTGSVVVVCGLWSAGSAVVAHKLRCSEARGIFQHQGSNPCPLHWQVISHPLRHQGSPLTYYYTNIIEFWSWKGSQRTSICCVYQLFCLCLHCVCFILLGRRHLPVLRAVRLGP